jgi:hypothetical protein
MSSTTTVTTSTTSTGPSKLQTILQIIQLALAGISTLPVVGPDAALASTFLKILTSGLSLYQAETGVPFDATLIPIETPVP